MISLYIPTNEEADRFLENIQKWVKTLKSVNVSADIAAYIARDFLSPMRIKPLEPDNDYAFNGQDIPREETPITQTQMAYVPYVETNGHE